VPRCTAERDSAAATQGKADEQLGLLAVRASPLRGPLVCSSSRFERLTVFKPPALREVRVTRTAGICRLAALQADQKAANRWFPGPDATLEPIAARSDRWRPIAPGGQRRAVHTRPRGVRVKSVGRPTDSPPAAPGAAPSAPDLYTITFPNILATLSGYDSGVEYEVTSGALEFVSQDESHLIHAAVRTHDGGGHSRTFPGLGEQQPNTAAVGRPLLIPNMSNNGTYRCSVVLFNPTAGELTADVKIIGSGGAQIGSTSRTLAGHEMEVITTELRAYNFSNATIRVDVTDGGGYILVTGQTAHNYSQDPAAHVAVQAQ
jgi:hypothetical protein